MLTPLSSYVPKWILQSKTTDLIIGKGLYISPSDLGFKQVTTRNFGLCWRQSMVFWRGFVYVAAFIPPHARPDKMRNPRPCDRACACRPSPPPSLATSHELWYLTAHMDVGYGELGYGLIWGRRGGAHCRLGDQQGPPWVLFKEIHTHTTNSKGRRKALVNIEASCVAPPEALTHSTSQMPLSCPVAPKAARS